MYISDCVIVSFSTNISDIFVQKKEAGKVEICHLNQVSNTYEGSLKGEWLANT